MCRFFLTQLLHSFSDSTTSCLRLVMGYQTFHCLLTDPTNHHILTHPTNRCFLASPAICHIFVSLLLLAKLQSPTCRILGPALYLTGQSLLLLLHLPFSCQSLRTHSFLFLFFCCLLLRDEWTPASPYIGRTGCCPSVPSPSMHLAWSRRRLLPLNLHLVRTLSS